jgi:hypothetical protein
MKTTDFITENEFIGDDAHTMHKDHEVQMARGDLYTAAKYAIDLHKMLKDVSELDGLEGWVQEKITLANDYLRTVHEYVTAQEHEAQAHEPEMFTPELAEAKFSKLIDDEAITEMNSSSIASAPGVGDGPSVGTLFGGSYSPKTPFKKSKKKK